MFFLDDRSLIVVIALGAVVLIGVGATVLFLGAGDEDEEPTEEREETT